MDSVISPSTFRSILSLHPTGVTIVTGVADHRPIGLAIGSFTSVSLDPPLVSICPAKTSSTWPQIAQSGVFCVNVLSAAQEALCRLFASPGEDRFKAIDWSSSPLGSPVLADVAAWIDCRIEAIHDAGDHEIVVGRVAGLDGSSHRTPLIFHHGSYGSFAEVSH